MLLITLFFWASAVRRLVGRRAGAARAGELCRRRGDGRFAQRVHGVLGKHHHRKRREPQHHLAFTLFRRAAWGLRGSGRDPSSPPEHLARDDDRIWRGGPGLRLADDHRLPRISGLRNHRRRWHGLFFGFRRLPSCHPPLPPTNVSVRFPLENRRSADGETMPTRLLQWHNACHGASLRRPWFCRSSRLPWSLMRSSKTLSSTISATSDQFVRRAIPRHVKCSGGSTKS